MTARGYEEPGGEEKRANGVVFLVDQHVSRTGPGWRVRKLPEAPRDNGGLWGKDRAFSPRFDQSAPLQEWGTRPDA